MQRTKKIAALIGAAAVVAGGTLLGTSMAGAAGGPVTTPKATDAFYACIASGNKLKNTQIFPADQYHNVQCASGEALYVWPSEQGAETGLAKLKVQLEDELGPVTATASTSVTKWPETSGWALDSFNRSVTVQRHSAVDAAKCGPTAKECWFYTGTLADNGTFTTVSGKPSPNAQTPINGVLNGSMIGGSGVEFYASSPLPDASLVPATQVGKAASGALSGTSTWVEQLFPAGTVFGAPKLPSYSWTYTAPNTCEAWVDSINPGDDGHGAADGDIRGINACPGE